MSKRNLILLVIVLGIIAVGAFVFLSFYQPATKTIPPTNDTNFFANFLPFGKSTTTTPKNTDEPVDVSGYVPPTETPVQNTILTKVSSFPIAGFGIFMKERFKDVPLVITPPDPVDITTPETTPTTKKDPKVTNPKPIAPPTEFVPAIRYVNKATGNIYQTFADKLDERKFSGTIIPKVYEAFFGNKGMSVIMRYLKNNKIIETFTGSLQKEYLGADSIGTNTVIGSFLPENITDMSVSSDSSQVFYIFNIGDGATVITLSLQTGTKVQVFDYSFTEWLTDWPSSKMITVTTKPSSGVPGFMYAINPDKKDFNKILGGVSGLTTLTSPNGKMVLYGDSNLSINLLNIGTGSSNLIAIKTLPEKCTWGGGSDVIYCAVPKFIEQKAYPDSWYQGEVSFSDEIWKIDPMDGTATKILDPLSLTTGEDIDGVKLALDDNSNYLFFVNKKDSYLWQLLLK
jgi:hypothetical protein